MLRCFQAKSVKLIETGHLTEWVCTDNAKVMRPILRICVLYDSDSFCGQNPD